MPPPRVVSSVSAVTDADASDIILPHRPGLSLVHVSQLRCFNRLLGGYCIAESFNIECVRARSKILSFRKLVEILRLDVGSLD